MDSLLAVILERMAERHVTPQQLSHAMGLSMRAISDRLAGKRGFTMVDVTRISPLLELTPDDLFSARPDRSATPPALAGQQLAYSLPAFADLVDVSVDTIRRAIVRGELTARYPTAAGRKPIVTREDGLEWLRSVRSVR